MAIHNICNQCLYKYKPIVCKSCILKKSKETKTMNDSQQTLKEPYVDVVHEIVKMATKGIGAIYEDYILKLIGKFGLDALKEFKLVETCGVINGRQLYVLVD